MKTGSSRPVWAIKFNGEVMAVTSPERIGKAVQERADRHAAIAAAAG